MLWTRKGTRSCEAGSLARYDAARVNAGRRAAASGVSRAGMRRPPVGGREAIAGGRSRIPRPCEAAKRRAWQVVAIRRRRERVWCSEHGVTVDRGRSMVTAQREPSYGRRRPWRRSLRRSATRQRRGDHNMSVANSGGRSAERSGGKWRTPDNTCCGCAGACAKQPQWVLTVERPERGAEPRSRL